jgi:hypothetical protein
VVVLRCIPDVASLFLTVGDHLSESHLLITQLFILAAVFVNNVVSFVVSKVLVHPFNCAVASDYGETEG